MKLLHVLENLRNRGYFIFWNVCVFFAGYTMWSYNLASPS